MGAFHTMWSASQLGKGDFNMGPDYVAGETQYSDINAKRNALKKQHKKEDSAALKAYNKSIKEGDFDLYIQLNYSLKPDWAPITWNPSALEDYLLSYINSFTEKIYDVKNDDHNLYIYLKLHTDALRVYLDKKANTITCSNQYGDRSTERITVPIEQYMDLINSKAFTNIKSVANISDMNSDANPRMLESNNGRGNRTFEKYGHVIVSEGFSMVKAVGAIYRNFGADKVETYKIIL